MTYVDVSTQVLAQLPNIGNHDALLNKDESVTFTFSVYTLARNPIFSARILSRYVDLPTVTVAPDPQFSTGIAGQTPVKAVFTRSGDPNAGPLTVYFTTGGTAIAGTSYAAGPAFVTFPVGASSVTVGNPKLRVHHRFAEPGDFGDC